MSTFIVPAASRFLSVLTVLISLSTLSVPARAQARSGLEAPVSQTSTAADYVNPLQPLVTGTGVRIAAQNLLGSELTAEQTNALNNIASIQAELWGDTILEGDYFAADDTKLDSVQLVYKNESLVAFRIIYSQTGWFTGKCDYDSRDPKTLNLCAKGRIRESSFVSLDFKDWLREDDAQFID